jgi:hypothetical protein
METMTRMNWRFLALVGASWLLGAGCINVAPYDGAYSCAKDTDCPTNYYCESNSRTCYKHGDVPPPIRTPGPDMSGSAGIDGGDTQQCHDGQQDGSETDVDCGGSCLPCATGEKCAVPHDCSSMLCNVNSKLCVASKCEDGVQDPGETDVDCGGTMCPACSTGKGCVVNADCVSDICNTADMKCAGDLCSDGSKDGMESDVDCGGPKCMHCGTGKMCGANTDCTSNVCSANDTCAAGLCDNGVQDPGETDIDCGGPCPGCGLTKTCAVNNDCASHFCNVMSLKCVADACHDGVKESGETDTDCGGVCGATCTVGQMCKAAGDCASGTCGSGGTCSSSQCSDGSKDGNETDIDCGGGTCAKCGNGKGCKIGNDCSSSFCNVPMNMCVDSQCKDGAQDGSETDVDCGGTCSTKCALTKGCKSGNDCASTWCNAMQNMCVDSQCKDGIKDNGESDVDCGGASTGCNKCPAGKGCGTTDANCASGYCNYNNNLCADNQCDDGRQDGNESDQDCGGSCVMPNGMGACGANKHCNGNMDCGSGACDYMPTPHVCVTSTCNDHHLDGNETDVDCGGMTCNTCANGKTCVQNSDCSSDYCDPSSHKCACGGLNQACCTGGACNTTDHCNPLTCNGSNTCVAGTPVSCPSPNQCQLGGGCDSSTGNCIAFTNKTGNCDLSTSNICLVQNSSTCSNGTCIGGSQVPDRCDGNNTHVQHCSNNMWNNIQTCTAGCSNGQCNVQVPTLTATINGSDVTLNWSASAGVTCSVLRSDNSGTYAAPATIISPCPAGIPQCAAYDRNLLQGGYNYELHCTDSSGNTGNSGPVPASGSLHPAVEICAGDWGINSVQVHAASSSNTDIPERTISTSTSLMTTIGVAYAAGTGTNCPWSDHSCGTILVASHDNDKIMSFDRRANDSDSLEPAISSEQTMTISLSGSGVTKYQPRALATIPDPRGLRIIVGMEASTGFLAGYPATFGTGTPTPDWYLAHSTQNKLTQVMSIAVDTGSGTNGGWVYVGSYTGSTFVINGYRYSDLSAAANINGTTRQNNVAVPFATISPGVEPDGIAIDSATHTLYLVSQTAAGHVAKYSTTDGSAQGSFTGQAIVSPMGIVFQPGGPGGSSGTVYISDNGGSAGAILAYQGGQSGPGTTPFIYDLSIASLVANAAGLAICN